ncbi:hypothetical protein Tco_1076305 [Tanacetum coccineum]
MEIDTTPSSPTLMTSARVTVGEEERELEPLMRKRIRELRLQGVATHLNYSSEDIDKERERERVRDATRVSVTTSQREGQAMEGIPSLLAAHLRETERRRRTRSLREAPDVHRIPVHGFHHSGQQLYIREGNVDGRRAEANLTGAPFVDPILISVQVYGRQVGRVLLDEGAAFDIIYEHYFLKLQKEVRERRKDVYIKLSRFSGEQVNLLGEISLQITMRSPKPHERTYHFPDSTV